MLYKAVLTKEANQWVYDRTRILPSEHDEEPYSHRARVVLDNSDGEFDSKNFKGIKAVISYGAVTGSGDEYSPSAPLWVRDQQLNSSPGKLTCELLLMGIPNLMGEDQASETYIPEESDTKTVKDLVNAICGATLDCFNHCVGFEVVWDVGYDPLADTYKPRDSFRIYNRGSRLAALRRVLDFTANVPRFGDDGKVHILQPVMTGITYDYEYNLTGGGHTFFFKAYRETLVIPNKVVVKSRPDDDDQYSGEAQTDDYASLEPEMQKTEYTLARLASNAEAADIAEALIGKARSKTERGAGEVPLNVGAEVYDYVQVTDQRQGDSRTGNIGYVHRRFGGGKWNMTFGFGNWLEILRYQNILKGLETYTDLGDLPNQFLTGEGYELPREFQRYTCDVKFTAVDWQTVAWTSGTLTLANGETQPVNAGQLVMLYDGAYYFYVAWGNSTLQYTQTYSDVLAEDRFYIAVAMRGAPGGSPYIGSDDWTWIGGDNFMDGLITTLKLANEAVTNAKVQVDTLTGDKLKAAEITARELAAGAVTEVKIATDAVTNAKLANAAVGTAELQNYAVNNIKLADLAVDAAKIASGAVTETKIGTDAVTSPKIVANAVIAAKIAAGAVIAAKIDAGAVTSEKIYAGAVTTEKLYALAVTSEKIAAGSIIAAKIAAGAVESDKIAANSIVGAHIQAGAIDAVKIQAGAVVSDKIAANQIAAIHIQTGAITADKIYAGAVGADKIAALAIQAGHISAGAIKAGHIEAGAIITDKLYARSIIAGKIDYDAIQAEHIKAGAIEADALQSTLILGTIIWAGDGHVKLSSSGIQCYSAGTEWCQIYNGQINIWGRANALVTRATKTGTIQCYVGSDGAIYAGVGAVRLDSDGITITGTTTEWLRFYVSTTWKGNINLISGTLNPLNIWGQDGIKLVVGSATRGLDCTLISFMDLPRSSTAPTTAEGRLAMKSATNYVKVYIDGAWRNIYFSGTGW